MINCLYRLHAFHCYSKKVHICKITIKDTLIASKHPHFNWDCPLSLSSYGGRGGQGWRCHGDPGVVSFTIQRESVRHLPRPFRHTEPGSNNSEYDSAAMWSHRAGTHVCIYAQSHGNSIWQMTLHRSSDSMSSVTCSTGCPLVRHKFPFFWY